MEKIVLLFFSAILLFSDESAVSKCNECHASFLAPPYKKVYKHYLLKYSSKVRVQKAMIDFLKEPSYEKSAMSKGLKKRFNPDEHLVFDNITIGNAVRYIIEQEDIVKRFKADRYLEAK